MTTEGVHQRGYKPYPQTFSPPPPGYDLPPVYASHPQLYPTSRPIHGYYSVELLGYQQGVQGCQVSSSQEPITKDQPTIIYTYEDEDGKPDVHTCRLPGLCGAICCICFVHR